MAKKPYLFITIGLFCVQGALSSEADESWLVIADTTEFIFRGKYGTNSLMDLDKQKRNGYFFAYEQTNKKTGHSQYKKVIVKLESCKRGYGYIYYNSMDGEFTGKDMFVRFGPTLGDRLGSIACTSWDNETGKASLKDKNGTWEVVATEDKSGNMVALKNDTLRQRRYANKQAVSALYRYNNIKQNEFEYGEYVVPLADCKRGYGVAHALDFDGKLLFKTDIVLNGNSVLSASITALCAKV